ncbi:MAG: ABC transporter substrate-binding protein [Acidimicrobiales bacterium]|nr:ABC transporter substrate-binding protein [Acidimicrobiales bacterium]
MTALPQAPHRSSRTVATGAVAVAALLLTALLGACTSSDDDSDDDGRVGARPGAGSVRLGLPGALVADPTAASPASPSDLMVLDLLHDGLTRHEPDGSAAPALAASWTNDGTFRTWTFVLDPAAAFTSGRAVSAADVVISLERVAAAGDASIAAIQLEAVTGFRPFVDGAAPHVEGLRAVDARTVEITLDRPLSALPEVLAAPAYGVVDPAALRQPVVELDLTGAWRVTAARQGGLTLARRPEAPAPIDTIELRTFADSRAAYAAFEAGDVDWAPVPVEEFGAAVEAHGREAFAPFQAELLLGLRLSGSLGRVELRQAVAAAIDREAIVRAVYPDLANPLPGVVPTGVGGHVSASCVACRPDVARARTLLATAFPDGTVPMVAIDVEAAPAQEALAAIVAEALAEVGIPSEVRARPLEEHERFVVSGAQELFTFGWVGGYAAPGAYLAPLFRSGSPENLTGLQDAEVDRLVAAAEAAASGPDAMAAWTAVEQRILEAAVVVPIAQFRTQVVVAPRVEGLVHAVDGSVDWSRVRVARSP